ncbi:MAG: AraC family transcriptional regulator [Caulobacter sp.]|nr:AraC family transcriptional regulator [Caulobacter sp.]
MSGVVSSIALTGAAELIVELGGRPDAMARDVGMPIEALSERDIPIRSKHVIRFFELAAARCGARDFGLRLARRQGLQVLGPLWVLIRNAPTVRAALTDLAANFAFYTTSSVVRIEPTRDGVAACYETRSKGVQADVQTIELALGILCLELRRSLGPRWNPVATQFRYSAPADLRSHRALFGDLLLFNQDRNALHIDGAACKQPLAPSSGHVHRVLSRAMRAASGNDTPSEATRVELALRAMLLNAAFDLPAVARELGVRPRTLQLRLSEEGVTFQYLLDRVRLDLAHKYLRESNLSAAEIAELLRFADSSVFSRFMRHQTGATPRTVRRDARLDAA